MAAWRYPMPLILLAVLLLAPPGADAQCCGDCDGNGQVSINELITAVNNALGQCQPSAQCPINFRDDNTQPGTADCYYIGRWNAGCGAADLEALWRSDGEVVIVNLLGFTPDLFIGGTVTGPNAATIVGWFRKPDASDLTELGGGLTLGPQGQTLNVDASAPPFDIEQCAFSQYRGMLEEVVVPQAGTAAARPRAIDPAALTRVRAALRDRQRASFQRR
ncbi:hypothetical protein KF840_21305 [bacterium]|nr:hypothetical protein [bacterium]